MKIKISENEKVKFSLWLPTRLVFNVISVRLYFFIIKIGLCKNEIGFSEKSLIKFVRGFYKIRKHFGGKLELVEVETKGGNFVKIIL